MKKILLLGGSHGQLPAIFEAKKRGLFTILCDYLPDNPGAAIADEFHLVSTTDKEAVLNIARERQIDYVLAYASDPAAFTAAFISESLGLPGNTVDSINTLADKAVFRKFLGDNGFSVPVYEVYDAGSIDQISGTKVPFPLVVKPVDSSDAKGIQLVRNRSELVEAAEYALRYSRKMMIILEEYIDTGGANLHGDGFVRDGQLIFCMLGDLIHTSYSHPLKPSSTLYPGTLPEAQMNMAHKEIARAILLSGFREGPVNIEARINEDGRFFIMEIGPRSGGSLTPQTIYYSSGFDMLGATLDLFMGIPLNIPTEPAKPAICFTLHTNCDGVFKGIQLDKDLMPYVAEEHIFVKLGDVIKSYMSEGSTLGVYIFKFDNIEQLKPLLSGFYDKVVESVKVF